MYDLTASKGLAAFILKRESREHVQVGHGSPDLCRRTTEYEKSKTSWANGGSRWRL